MVYMPPQLQRYAILFVIAWLSALPVTHAVERLQTKIDGKSVFLTGKVLLEGADGDVLLMTPEGRALVIQGADIVERTKDEQPFTPMKREEVARRVLAELPPGFKVYMTSNYVICYNTSLAYAQWCGALFERLNRAFDTYWDNRDFKLTPPEFPLVALIFDGKETYSRFVREELGDATSSIVGFYSPKTNRINMYDLTGVEELRSGNDRGSSSARINQILSQPNAGPLVATVVHEATHQLAYNRGLQTRLADNPAWVSEGLAVYFETPDLKSSKGWASIGAVHRGRLQQFRAYLQKRPEDSLVTLIRDDKRLKDAHTAIDSYAEAWALNYYLLRTRSKDYVQYLRQLSTLQPLMKETPEVRLKLFLSTFGSDLQKFDSEFLRYMRRVD